MPINPYEPPKEDAIGRPMSRFARGATRLLLVAVVVFAVLVFIALWDLSVVIRLQRESVDSPVRNHGPNVSLK